MVLYLYHVGGRLVRSAEGTDYIGGEGGEAGTSRQAGEEEDFADLYDNVNGDGDDSSDEDFALSGDGDAESDSESVVYFEEAVQSVADLGDQRDNGEGERHEERWEATGYLTEDNDEELNFVMREKQQIEAEIRGAGGFNNDGGGPILEGSGAGDMEGNMGNLVERDDDVNATDEGGINVQASEQCGDKEDLVGFESDEQGSYPSSSDRWEEEEAGVEVEVEVEVVYKYSYLQPHLLLALLLQNNLNSHHQMLVLMGLMINWMTKHLLEFLMKFWLVWVSTNSNVEDNAQTNTEAVSASANVGLNTEAEDGGQVTATEDGGQVTATKGGQEQGHMVSTRSPPHKTARTMIKTRSTPPKTTREKILTRSTGVAFGRCTKSLQAANSKRKVDKCCAMDANKKKKA
ncbi:hypothetical protein Tsubulata_041028 [Turnera subulata]|uniref:Uncharacterized protein n=1 Tax=Turnera subulata TaxID=218843 RepID=A0A9Q0F4T4_9ROSI|nr:hypothetical protein Tsubulata_041028 [Turnera subulata]